MIPKDKHPQEHARTTPGTISRLAPQAGAVMGDQSTVRISDHSKASQEAFERSISDAPDVRECHNITGVFEYLLRVEVSDLAAYKVFHSDVLGTLP